jgi:Cdc6-like AAA superfamily ATPase
MPTLRSGFAYGEGKTSTRHVLNNELDRCYHEHERFNTTSNRFGLLFLDVPSEFNELDKKLLNIKYKHKPSSVVISKINNLNGTYCAIVTVNYSTRVNITRCAYFSAYDLIPLVLRNPKIVDRWVEDVEKYLLQLKPELRLTSKTLNDRSIEKDCRAIRVDKPIPDSGSLVIYGNRGSGKTSLAKRILDYKGLVVENIERDLVKFNPLYHRGIIFENMDFRKYDEYPIQGMISDSDRKIKYNDTEVFIPKGTRIIFTTRYRNGNVFNSKAKCVKSMVTKLNIR